ncbi:MAG: HIT family protein [Hyphomicrobiaceae bacterium]|nr:MAG: HIT family protein [Hyphomicrobiaceae bacterium]
MAASDLFQLDPQLARDTHVVGSMELSRVLLTNDRRFPWLILVPQRPGLADLIDLDPPERLTLLEEISCSCEALKAEFKPHKLNVAALGNVVRQLHVHVIARSTSDAAWPKPVWGVGAAEPYGADELKAMSKRLRSALRL